MLTPESNSLMHVFHIDDLEWEVQTSKSRRKLLRLTDDFYLAVVRWDSGFTLPTVDEHGGEETIYVLEGTFVDEHAESGPGTVIRAEPGSSHRPGTRNDEGCTYLIARRLVAGERERIAPGN
jgi:anti-sigma factor ChrR (cupin superfamily)